MPHTFEDALNEIRLGTDSQNPKFHLVSYLNNKDSETIPHELIEVHKVIVLEDWKKEK